MSDPKATLPATDIPPDAIILWVVYDHPVDHPDAYVLRPQFAVMETIERPERYSTVTQRMGRVLIIASRRSWVCSTLDEARALVPDGCWQMPEDNPVIAGVWMQ